jgi:hypothetical protein
MISFKKISICFIFVLFGFYSSAQTKTYGTLGGEVYYNIKIPTSYTHKLLIYSNLYFNCSKGNTTHSGYPIYNNINGGFYSKQIDLFSNNSILCSYNYFSSNYWGNVNDTDGIYIKQSGESDSLINYNINNTILQNGWVITLFSEHFDTTVKNIIHQTNPYLNFLDKPLIYSRIYPIPSSFIPFTDNSVIF